MRRSFRPSFWSDAQVVRDRRGMSAGAEVARCRCTGDGHRIVGVRTGNHLQHGDGIFERARHRAGDVREQVERDHARTAGEAHRRADAGERLMRRRAANRVAGVASETDGAEVGGDGRGRASARSGRHAVERVWILRVARQDRAHGLVRRERELGHVRLGQDDRSGRLDPLDLERITARDEALEREGAGRALEADRLEVVLDDGRDAVKRSDKPALLRAAVQIVGLRHGVGIDEDDSVDRGSGLVVRLDPLEVLLDESPAGELPGLHRGVNARDGRLFQLERRGRLLRFGRDRGGGDGERGEQPGVLQ